MGIDAIAAMPDQSHETLDFRDISPHRQYDSNSIIGLWISIVGHQRLAQAAGLHTDDRVILRVKAPGATERLGGDGIGLYPVFATLQLAFHHIGEEGLKLRCGGEFRMAQDMT